MAAISLVAGYLTVYVPVYRWMRRAICWLKAFILMTLLEYTEIHKQFTLQCNLAIAFHNRALNKSVFLTGVCICVLHILASFINAHRVKREMMPLVTMELRT